MTRKYKIRNKILIGIVFIMLIYILPVTDIKAYVHLNNTLRVQILATTNLNGKFTSYEYAQNSKLDGGLTQILTLVKTEREKNKNTIVIDNGNSIQGNYSHLFLDDEKNPMILAMNEIGYDVLNLGYNELNLGVDKITSLKEQENNNLNVVCANLYKDEERVFDGFIIKEIDNKIKVAIIGVTSPNISRINSENIEEYKVKNPVDEVGVAINEIKAQGGADIYVVSANIGSNLEKDLSTEIAIRYDEISAIIMGDCNGVKDEERVNNALLIKPGNNGSELGKIEITLEKINNKYKIINKESDLISTKGILENKELSEKLETYNERAISDANTKIGVLDESLAIENEIKEIPESIISDQGITDFINEVQLYYSEKQLEELGINMDNSYHVSASSLFEGNSNMILGDITNRKLYNIYKYDNLLYTIKTTGKQIKKFMESSASVYNTFKEGDLTVSLNERSKLDKYDMFDGVKYEINISKEPGERIEKLVFEKDNKEVKDDDIVYLAINSYKYDYVLNSSINAIFDKGSHKKICDTSNYSISYIRDLIKDYIINIKNGEVTKNIGNNWKLTGVKYDIEKRNTVVRLVNEGKLEIPSSEDGDILNIRSITWEDVIKVNDKSIDIITFNNLNYNLQEDEEIIDNTKIATSIKEKQELKSNDYEAFVFSTGDIYNGVAVSNLDYGKSVLKFLDEINLLASVIGSNEFETRKDKIESWKNEENFSFLAANIVESDSKNPITWAKPYLIIESNGLKVGVIGISSPETIYKNEDKNINSLEITRPETVVNKYAKELKHEQDVDAVLVLSNLGISKNKITGEITGEAAELAKSVYNVDAIIAKNNYESIEGVVNNIPIVEAGGNERSLANLNFKFNAEGKLLNVKGNIEFIYKQRDDMVLDKVIEDHIK